jgi:hypothetical protein
MSNNVPLHTNQFCHFFKLYFSIFILAVILLIIIYEPKM